MSGDPTLQAKAIFDTNAALAAMNEMARQTKALGAAMRSSFSEPAKEATKHVGGLTEFIREQRQEMRGQTQIVGLMSKEYGGLATALGVSKDAFGGVASMLGALAMGGVAGAAFESIKLLAEWFNKAGEEAKKLETIRVKIETDGAQELYDAETQWLAFQKRKGGASEEEIRAFEAVRGNAKALKDIQDRQVLLVEKMNEKQAEYRDLEVQSARAGQASQGILSAKKAELDELNGEWRKNQKVIEDSNDAVAHAGGLKGRIEDEKKAAEEIAKLREKEAAERKKQAAELEELDRQSWRSQVRIAYAAEDQIIDKINKGIAERDKMERQANDALADADAKRMQDGMSQQDRMRKEMLSAATTAAVTTSEAIGTSLAGLITGAKTAEEAIGAMVGATLTAVVDMAEKIILAYAAEAMAGAMAGNSSIPVVGIAIGAAAAVTAGAMVKALIGQLPARAAGGPVSAGTTYLVGERGPELFRAPSNGSIVPNHQLAGAGGMNIHIHPTDATGLERLLTDKPELLIRPLRKAIRGGKF